MYIVQGTKKLIQFKKAKETPHSRPQNYNERVTKSQGRRQATQ